MWLESLTYWHWFGFGMLLLVAELIGAAGFLLWTGISALVVGLLLTLFPQIEWRWQLFAFAILTLASLFLWWRHLQRHIDKSDDPLLNHKAKQFIGRRTVLVTPISQGRGKIKLDDSQWLVSGPDAPEGTPVKVIGMVDELVLEVELES